MNLDIKNLPYAHFERLGMSRKDVVTMSPQELASMLKGGRTGLLPLKIELGKGVRPFQVEAKLSLSQNLDKTLSLEVHLIQAKPTNTIDATPEQWEKMLKGELIVKNSKAHNGSIEPHIHQLDRQTNEILTTRVNAIQLPHTIKDTVLTPEHKEQLKKGLALELETRAQEPFIVRLDLNEASGYVVILN